MAADTPYTAHELVQWATSPGSRDAGLSGNEWLRLITEASFKSRDTTAGRSEAERLAWGRAAVRLADRAAETGALKEADAKARRLGTRIALLNTLSPTTQDDLTTPEAIATEFLAALPVTQSEAEAIATRWSAKENLPTLFRDHREEFTTARIIKSLSNGMDTVLPHLPFGPLHQDVQNWLALAKRMP